MPRYEAEVAQAIARWAPAFGVSIPRAVVHGILEQESLHGTHPTYVRHQGRVPEPGGRYSYGPMQVLESTAKALGARNLLDLARNPAVGISYGVRYFAELVRRFKGDLVKSISAYNAGPARVGINPAYVQSVLKHIARYQGFPLTLPAFPGATAPADVLRVAGKTKPSPSGALPAGALLAGLALLFLVMRRRRFA